MTHHGRPFAAALTLLLAAVAGAFLAPAPAARAQGFGGPPPATFAATVTPSTARPGDKVTVSVTATIREGYHLYSVVPVPPPGPQETRLTVTGPGLTAAGGNIESAPKRVNDPNFGKELGLHYGTATFSQAFTVAKTAKPGKLPLSVSLRYMACTESSCLPPKTVTITPAPVLTVAAGGKGAAAPVAGEPAAPSARATLTGAPVKTGPVEWGAALSRADVRPGEAVAVTVSAKIDEPFHIYATTPVPPPGPQETRLTVTGTGVTAAGPVRESEPEQVNDPNFGKVIGMHNGTATFTQVVTVGSGAAAGKPLPLTVQVRYMACNESSCLPPKTVTLAVPPLQVAAGPARAEFTKDAVAAAALSGGTPAAPTDTPPPSGGGTADPSATPAPAAETGGLGPFLLGAFGAGLLALITPCVFPMIPVTLAFFTKQATAQGKEGAAARGSVVRLAATYSLGIVVAFTGIGAVMAATVGAAGANRLAANPWVNLVFAVLFFVFAFALLEVFDLRPPAALQGLTTKGRTTGGAVGVLLMGLTFVIAAFTCTAPFIGTVLVAAASAQSGAQWVRPILGMATFAAALALPFFLLSLFPALLAKLPRSGAWLSTVKGAMGFVELAAALKFLSNADLVWQWGILTQPVLLALWATIAVAAALWLAGLLKVGLGAPEGRLTPARGAWTAAFAAAAVYCFYGLTGRPVAPLVAAILPPADYGRGAAEGDLRWYPTLEEGLQASRSEGKPVFIDFTGYTCTNCRWVERNVFARPEIRDRLKDFVLVRLYTDDNDPRLADARQAYQQKTFGTVALPLYAVLGPDGKPLRHGDVAYFGGTLSPEKFAQNFTAFLNAGEADRTQVAKN